MEAHDRFDEHGFLSIEITDNAGRLRADSTDWFELADDLNASLMRVANFATGAIKTSSWDPKAVAVRVLLRSCGALQGVIILTERGMVAEGRSLVRSLLENAFCIAALVAEPDIFTEMLRNDSEASRQGQRKFIDAQNLIADGAARDRLKEMIGEVGKIGAMNLKSVAELGAVLDLYLAYQRLSDDAAHLSARSLNRHVQPNECAIFGQMDHQATLYVRPGSRPILD